MTELNPNALVSDFQKTFNTPMTEEFWMGLVKEELGELIEAVHNFYKELSDLTYVGCGLENVSGKSFDQLLSNLSVTEGVDQDALTLAIIITAATPARVIGDAFRRVHASNMSKVQPDGSVLRDPVTGKVLKPETYVAPDMSGLLSS